MSAAVSAEDLSSEDLRRILAEREDDRKPAARPSAFAPPAMSQPQQQPQFQSQQAMAPQPATYQPQQAMAPPQQQTFAPPATYHPQQQQMIPTP
jgi:hypothetical protein